MANDLLDKTLLFPYNAAAILMEITRGNMSEQAFEPMGDRVVVRPLGEEERGETSPSGIIIPDSAKEKPEEGTVIAVGPGRFEHGARVPMQVKVGDRVMFSKYGYDEVKYKGDEYYIVSESSLLAIIKE